MDLPDGVQESLLCYLDLLISWNKVYNLTAIMNPLDMVTKHLLDSLAVISHVSPGRILDVGSGAGLPAIPLALARPELSITALDSNQKKIRFIKQVMLELRIQNLQAVHHRVENYLPTMPYDAIIARAFASIFDLVTMTAHLLVPGGLWLAMKGVRPDAELVGLPSECMIKEIIPLRIPNLQAERHLVVLVARGPG